MILRVFINSEVNKIDQRKDWDSNCRKRDKDRLDVEDKETRQREKDKGKIKNQKKEAKLQPCSITLIPVHLMYFTIA